MKKRTVKKTKTKRKKKKKTKATQAKASAAAADSVKTAQAAPITLPTDPWSKYKSPYGGSLSPADEWNRICQMGSGPKKQLSVASINISSVLTSNVRSAIDAALHVTVASTISDASSVAATAASPAATTISASAASATATTSVDPTDSTIASSNAEGAAQPSALAEKLILRDHGGDGKVADRLAEAVPFSALMRATLTSLDVSDTHVTSAALAAIGPCWLRELYAGGTALTSVPSLSHMPRLLKLHLHNHPALTLLDPEAFNACPNLRELSLRSCGLITLGKDKATADAEQAAAAKEGATPRVDNVLSKLMFLETLDVAANHLLSPSLQSLTMLRQLQRINLIGNPGLEHPDFSLAMFPKKLPRLKLIDGVEQRLRVGVTKVNLGAGHLSSLVASSGEDSASCSCLEGNPCAVKYNCKNWDRRFEIAKQARLAKGIKDI